MIDVSEDMKIISFRCIEKRISYHPVTTPSNHLYYFQDNKTPAVNERQEKISKLFPN